MNVFNYLIIECEACKYLPEVSVQTKSRKSEVCAEKPELFKEPFNKLFSSKVSGVGLLVCFFLLFRGFFVYIHLVFCLKLLRRFFGRIFFYFLSLFIVNLL